MVARGQGAGLPQPGGCAVLRGQTLRSKTSVNLTEKKMLHLRFFHDRGSTAEVIYFCAALSLHRY